MIALLALLLRTPVVGVLLLARLGQVEISPQGETKGITIMGDVMTKDAVQVTRTSPLAATTTREVERIVTTIATLIMLAETIVEKTEAMSKGATTEA